MAARESEVIVKDHALSSSSTDRSQPSQAPQPKTSTLRFASDNNTSTQLAKTSRRSVNDSDESTPFRKTDSNTHRSYNTSDTTLPVPSTEALAATSATSQDTETSNTTESHASLPWYKKVAEKYGSVTLENKASVARDHLALERTFLAWLRTSLSFASIGIAITQLFRLNATLSSRPTSQTVAVAGTTGDVTGSSTLPFSPFLGHAIPAEILPFLQYVASSAAAPASRPTLGPTLLDQLLLLSADGRAAVEPYPFSSRAVQLTEDTATRLRHVGKPLGATFIGISVLVLLVGAQRYFDAQHWIIQGKFPASRGSISLVAFIAFALVVASLVVVIVISPTSYET